MYASIGVARNQHFEFFKLFIIKHFDFYVFFF